MRTGISVFVAIGFLVEVLQVPFSRYILLLALASSTIWALYELFKRPEGPSTWMSLSYAAWATYLFMLIDMQTFRSTMILVAAGITVIAVFQILRARPIPWIHVLYLLGLTGVMLVFTTRPVSERYYASHLRFSLANDQDVHAWDMYSFHLEQEGLILEAVEANERAMFVARSTGKQYMLSELGAHRELIRLEKWEQYTPLPADRPTQ